MARYDLPDRRTVLAAGSGACVWRGILARTAARSSQWREALDRNHWRRPYWQHDRRTVGQERAQSVVLLASSRGIEEPGGKSPGPLAQAWHDRTRPSRSAMLC